MIARAMGLWCALASGAAWADDAALARAQAAELDRARAEVAGQMQLLAYDLIDEMVYRWSQSPVVAAETPVVLVGVTVPAGLGSGMASLLENHLSELMLRHPETGLSLVHCPVCTAMVVHSGPEGTRIARGIDDPTVLAQLGQDTERLALFVDIEAEGAALVLRARLTRLTPTLPIVWSHTLSSEVGVAALLRSPTRLQSAEEARQEYVDMLEDGGRFLIPLRMGVRSFERSSDGFSLGAPPFLWFQSGIELSPTTARVWTSSFLVGYSVVPQAYQGIMGQVRQSRLLTGRSRSLTHPDLYGFIGGAVMTVWGPSAASFRIQPLTVDEVLGDTAKQDPRATFATLQFGADLRLGNRVGLSSFFETIPSLRTSDNLADYFYFLGLPWSTWGTEVTFWF